MKDWGGGGTSNAIFYLELCSDDNKIRSVSNNAHITGYIEEKYLHFNLEMSKGGKFLINLNYMSELVFCVTYFL
jgi:hypothetical protein